jgi:hypothetical protein
MDRRPATRRRPPLLAWGAGACAAVAAILVIEGPMQSASVAGSVALDRMHRDQSGRAWVVASVSPKVGVQPCSFALCPELLWSVRLVAGASGSYRNFAATVDVDAISEQVRGYQVSGSG